MRGVEIITASPRFPRVVDGVITTVRCDVDTCTVRSAVGVRSSGWTAAVRHLRCYNRWGKPRFVFTASVLVFTASLCSSESCCALGFPSTFPSFFLRFHRRRRRSAMVKPKKSSSAVGTSAVGGKKGTTATRVTDGGWRRSETRESDLRKLREWGLIPQDREAVKLPGNEVIPRPPAGYRVMFLAFVMRVFSFPFHNFLRGLLFLYGIQL